MSEERYIPEFFAAQQEVLRLNRELRAERDAHHTFKIGVEKERILKANAADCDVANIEAIIDGSKPRVDTEGRVVIDYGPDKSRVGTLAEALQFMRDNPDLYGNIVGIKPKREPTAQDLHNEKLRKMNMQQMMAYRKRRGGGNNYLTPE